MRDRFETADAEDALALVNAIPVNFIEAEDALLAMKDASRKKAHDFDLDAIAAQYEAVLADAAKK